MLSFFTQIHTQLQTALLLIESDQLFWDYQRNLAVLKKRVPLMEEKEKKARQKTDLK